MPHQLLHHQSPRQPARLPRLNQNESKRPQIISASKVNEDSAPVPKRHKSTNLVIETVIQQEALQPPAHETPFELPVVSPPATPPIGTWSPEEYDYDDYAR